MSVEQIIEEAAKLPLDERRAIVESLASGFSDEDWNYDLSRDELRQRVEEVVSGRAELLPVSEALRELEKRFCRTT